LRKKETHLVPSVRERVEPHKNNDSKSEGYKNGPEGRKQKKKVEVALARYLHQWLSRREKTKILRYGHMGGDIIPTDLNIRWVW
jgi:hypothetical protein